jgi:hypothetical protein
MDSDVKEADIWNQCSKGKNIVERCIGKDAMFLALREQRKKRPRADDGIVSDE